jgi:L-fucose isomerase
MPVTMSRLNLVKGLGPVLQLAEGYTIDLPEDVYQQLNERTDPTWPTHWFVPRLTATGPFRDVYSVMNSWGANHGALSFGHIGADLLALASLQCRRRAGFPPQCMECFWRSRSYGG